MERDLTTMVSNDVAQALTTQVQACVQPSAEGPLRGSVLVLIQFDVCEEIHLDELRKLFPARSAEARFKNAPAYVQYQRPPVEETLDPIILDSGERLTGEIKYYDYGVVSLVFELPFPATGTALSNFPAAGPPTPTSRSWPAASSARGSSAPPRR